MCNCVKQTGAAAPTDGTPTTPTTPTPLTIEAARVKMPTAERAVLCWVCPHARAADRRGGLPGWCSRVRGRDARWCAGGATMAPLVERLADGRCPRARFVPGERTTRWLGVAWIGLPMPLRWLARVAGPAGVPADGWHGCGCVRVLRAAWDRLAGLVVRAVRPGRATPARP